MTKILSDAERMALDDLLGELDAALDTRAREEASALMTEIQALAGEDHPRSWYARALVTWEFESLDAAVPLLEAAVERDGSLADAHHALGVAFEAAGDDEKKVEHFLKVLWLDAKEDRKRGLGSRDDVSFIAEEAERILDELPLRFRETLHNVPVVLEARPARYLVEEGFDPRALGLFEGASTMHDDVHTAPTRIVLFVNNLLAITRDDDELVEQIEVTILHEIGHFFGLDEDEVADLGLA